MTKKKIEDQSRGQIAVFLPEAIAAALKSYRRFMNAEEKGQSKDFADHHKACQAAIAHVDLLLKLAQWADLPDAGEDSRVLGSLMQEAEEELARY